MPKSTTQAITAMKIADILPRFDGTKGKDVSAWLEQVELAKELFEIDNMAKVIPFFMDGEAFEVFKQLAPEDKGVEGKIKDALTRAFAVSKWTAYEEFCGRRWRMDETVEAFLTDLKRLARISGMDKADNA
ncbi:Uncharacterized protein FKW44_011262, partial [Caligus rogercresseyi]